MTPPACACGRPFADGSSLLKMGWRLDAATGSAVLLAKCPCGREVALQTALGASVCSGCRRLVTSDEVRTGELCAACARRKSDPPPAPSTDLHQAFLDVGKEPWSLEAYKKFNDALASKLGSGTWPTSKTRVSKAGRKA
jgi:hypothetical protein